MTNQQLIRIGDAACFRLATLLPLRKSLFASLKCYDDIHPELCGGLLHASETETLMIVQEAIDGCWHSQDCSNYVI